MTDPQTIVASARPGDAVVGWKLQASERERLLAQFPPIFAETVADHVTLAPRVAADTPLPDPLPAAVVGRADDGKGVEALVVAIGGSTDRPGGGTYHITWSLADGRRPRESNDVIRECGWTTLDDTLPIELVPQRFR